MPRQTTIVPSRRSLPQQQQLGLRLESEKIPATILVIDHIGTDAIRELNLCLPLRHWVVDAANDYQASARQNPRL